jgi:hypothetical protein
MKACIKENELKKIMKKYKETKRLELQINIIRYRGKTTENIVNANRRRP